MTSEDAIVVFMGSPDFAVPSLDALNDSGRYRPRLVVTQPDRQSGRGRKMSPTAVKSRARKLDIPTLDMSKENYAEVVEEIAALRPDVVVVTAFGIIIKNDLLELPRYGCVNVHASLLPKYRGVSPIQAALLAGDEETGCTTIKMDAGIDTGEILLKQPLAIRPDDTAGTLSERLSRLGAGLLVRTLDGLWEGALKGTPQENELSSYTRKIKKSDGKIDWSLDAAAVMRRVRAMTPWPSAYTFFGERRIIVAVAAETAAAPGHEDKHLRHPDPGRVLRIDPMTIACGRGSIVIQRLKPEGRAVMSASSFAAGHTLKVGDRLG